MTSTVATSEATGIDTLLEKVYQGSGYDFRQYKPGTVMRRLQRRLYATGTDNYLEYTRFIDTHPEEYQMLADDLTIKVSGFFRSPYTFQQMTRLVLPELVLDKRRRSQPSLNIWSAACAQGEEPYSIAAMLVEFLGDRLGDFQISIYASDISLTALKKAEAGVYTNIDGLPDSTSKNYFTRYGNKYVLRTDIRKMVNFFYFDLTSTTRPPFTADCIFCCNLLIYLQKQLQERVLNMLYESLATPGYLVLGEVETPADSLRGKLECLDSKAKIYQKRGVE